MSFLDEIIDPDLSARYIAQGTPEWETIRIGRFTASEIYRLMGFAWRPMTQSELDARPKKGEGSKVTRIKDFTSDKLDETAMSYVTEKAAETMTMMVRQSAYAFTLAWGKDQEQYAIEYFIEKTGFKYEKVGFFPYTNQAGGSPDGFINDEDILEVKCPESTTQIEYLMYVTWHDIMNNKPEYYWQCQANMLFTGKNNCHFITYDPRMVNDDHKMTHIIIPANEQDQDRIIKKIEGAVKEKLSLLKTLSK